ncbi:FecCD family ABC transporter permease [Paenibacillus sp. SYP-B4298]|uniref:FecCD family ABC transporter permease n=1 Tax=Paenibacillus sp. SYP-B4298 TaxID=2996034 RepID=UPI0022DD0629|nr:iron ABC transporter permease [Paenibacillus sp. SYP-B4298]
MTKPTRTITLLLLLAASLLLSLVSLSLGSIRVPLPEVIQSLFGGGEQQFAMIIMQFRLPRVLAALLVGAALAVAGALLQGIIRNPLASPDVLGVTGGASVSVVAFMTLAAGMSIHLIPFVAIAGAGITAALNYVLAWRRGVSPYRLVMIGIGISTATAALTTFLLISGPAYLAPQVLNWTTGSLYGTNWTYIGMLWPWIALFLPLALLFARELDVQALGEETALGLGSRLQRSRLLMLAISVSLAGAAVGVAGSLSFIGLIAPHMARRLVGHSYRAVLPAAALCGAILLVAADLAGRLLFQPLDIPAGVFTAGIGAPFFMYLLMRRRRSG